MKYRNATNPNASPNSGAASAPTGAGLNAGLAGAAPEVADPLSPDTDQDAAADGGILDDSAGDDSGAGDDGNEPVEIEYEGKTYTVPKALQQAFLRHADYTRKTQELGNKRRELAADRERLGQQAAAHLRNLGDATRIAAIDDQLNRLRQVNLPRLAQQNPAAARQVAMQAGALGAARHTLSTQIQSRERAAALEAKRNHATRLDQCCATAARDIPNWSPGTAAQLREFGLRHGLGDREVTGIADPRHLKLLHLAWIGEQLANKQRAPSARPEVEVRPARQVGSGGSPSVRDPSTPSGDDMDPKAWAKARNQQQFRKRRKT